LKLPKDTKMNFNIKTKNEISTAEEIQVIRINIFKNIYDETIPYFFIRNHLDNKNYRISISFDYLNKKFGINIGILRDFSQIRLSEKSLQFFLLDFILIEKIKIDDNVIGIMHYSDPKYPTTSIFKITKVFKNDVSETLVFFSKEFSNINIYLKKKGME